MNPKTDRNRLGDLLVDMRLVDEATLQAALTDQRQSGQRLPTILAQRRVLDEERLTKAVAARLGLEAVSVAAHKIHERVLALIPHAFAKRYGVLPIAIKRTQQAEVLYLVMMDPLNAEALGEVQRITGRQVRVLMASATELDHCIEAQYSGLEARLAASGSARPARAAPSRPPIIQGTAGSGPTAVPPTPPPLRTPVRRAGSAVGPPARARGSSGVSRPPAGVTGTPVPSTITQTPRPAPSSPGELRLDRPEPRTPSIIPGTAVSRGRTPVPPVGRIPGPPPLSAPPLPLALEPLAPPPRPKPAPFPMGASLDLSNPATLIDTARPPELEGLSRQLSSQVPVVSAPPASDPELVIPSPLDPPDSEETRVEYELHPSAAQVEPEPVPLAAPPAAPPRDRGIDWALGTPDWDDNDVWSGLDAADDAVVEPEDHAKLDLADEQWAQATGLDLDPSHDLDGPEDIATSQLELSEASKAALRMPERRPPRTKADPRTLASTLEVPVELEERDNPFDGPGPDDVPTGLERTGIFPAIDFSDDNFDPPALSDPARAFAGLSDIPESERAVQARFGPVNDRLGDEDAIEEIVLEPLDVEEAEAIELESMELPTVERASPFAAQDGAGMPVIEPSSLLSLLDEDGSDNADTGSAPMPARATPPPETRVFDESHRRTASPSVDPTPEEPTNPRMQADLSLPDLEVVPRAEPPRPVMPAPFPVSEPQAASAPILPPLAAPSPPPSAVGSSPPPLRRSNPPAAEASEEPTPARDTLERADVLSALDDTFVPRAESVSVSPTPVAPPVASVVDDPPPTREAPSPARAQAQGLLDALLAGGSLDSPQRAQLGVALARLLVSKGLVSEADLLDALILDP